MSRRARIPEEERFVDLPPATTPEGQEQRMIVLAERQAEKQLREGVAPVPVVVHYLKLATEREKLEREKLANENRVLEARVEGMAASLKSEELYAEVLSAFKTYSGNSDDEEDDYYDE